ncbi:NAD+ synthase [uncultured Sneathiella sp.]|jgi:NAD+ synthase|uniref:NAD+ synthase n=1 Tax=uncultured Sneathiella sp. TaxID=879315 RepID=UPI0030DA3795|tara:strand:- start:19315 stop:20976 length:1662 start_codon:yes stop_codon:yes gene_type:complete
MTDQLKIALAQANPTLGSLEANVALARAFREEAEALGADIVVYPELFLSGYPPEDLVRKPAFQRATQKAMEDLAELTLDGGPAMLMSAPMVEEGKLYNAVCLLEGGKIAARRFKNKLPNYGVFDEYRIFKAGPLPGPIPFKGVRLGVMICEDMWFPEVAECLAETGAEILIVPNGSPYDHMKSDERLNHAVERVTETGLPLVYVNQIGGQDELVFDGASFVLNADRSLPVQMTSWKEILLVTDWHRKGDGWVCETSELVDPGTPMERIYHAMVLGLKDYVEKNRFPGVVLGLSGGIDSALSAAVAVDALGPDRVHCVMMPSKYTSQESLDDAAGCAEMLGTRLDTISIAPGVEAMETMLADIFAGQEPDITEENIQSRLRGMTLMAISNKLGPMVLTTGNKSEMSVGYATLYGDMCGGYSVLKDVYKMTCFKLSDWRNTHYSPLFRGPDGPVMPERVITKPPSAELRVDQKDEDSLPPYEILDGILHGLVEEEKSLDELVTEGFDTHTIARIQNLLYIAEYKRRQSPPGVKISTMSFGRDRRYPITNGFRDKR